MKLKALLMTLLIAAPTVGMAKYYPMLCKGAKSVDMYTVGGKIAYVMDFNKARKKAGPRGINLAPNTCSWVDRPLRNNEPTEIVFRKYSGHRYIMINQCMNNPNCVFRVKVAKERGGRRFLTWRGGNGSIRFYFHE